MAATDDKDLGDVRAEEGSRGRKQPTTAVSRERVRKVKHLLSLLANPSCTLADFLAAVRGYGIKDESAEFHQLFELWKNRRGNA